MQAYRINALIRRYFILTIGDPFRLIDMFYWPLFDLTLWGFTSVWIGQAVDQAAVPSMVLGGLILWIVMHRVQLEVSVNLMEELWSRNIVNLFATPLQLSEWIISVMIVGLLKGILIGIGSAAFVVFFYHVNILELGFPLILWSALLIGSGWGLGFLTASCIVYWGQRVQVIAWVISSFFAPLTGVFYPVSVLPPLLQNISYTLPMTYVFEGLRIWRQTNVFSYKYLAISALLTILYVVVALFIFSCMFEKSRTKGLARLENE